MTTNGLTTAQQQAALAQISLANATGTLTTAQMSEILISEGRNKADAEALLLNTGLITSNTAEAGSINTVTAAKLKELVQTNALTKAEANLLAAKAGIILTNQKEASSFTKLGTGIKNIGNSIKTIAVSHPILTAIVAVIGSLIAAFTIAEKKNKEFIESQKELIEKYDENIQKYDDEISSLDALQIKLEESKGNKEALAQIQKELNDAIGKTPGLLDSESNAYDVANQKINDRIKRLEKLRKSELDNKITAQKEIFNNSLVENAWGIDHKFDYFSKHKLIASDLFNAPFKGYIDGDLSKRFATLQELFNNLKKNNYDNGEKSNAEIWKELIDSYGGAILDTTEIQNFFDNQTKYAQELLEDYINNSDTIFSTEELNSIIENLIESGYSQDLDGIKDIITSLVENDDLEELINKYYESLFDNEIDSDELYQNIKIQFDELSNKYPEIKSILGNFFDNIGKDVKSGISEVSNSTDSSLLSLDDAKTKVNGLKDGDTEIIGLIDELSLLQEVLTDTDNIQEETYSKLISCSSKYTTAIRTENGRITVNASKLKAVAKSRQLDTKEAIRQTLALKKQEWVQWNQGIENYNGTLLENIEMNYEDIDSLQKQITQYELLVNSIDEASNAFKRFEAAKSVDEQDMFTTAQDAFNLVNETLNKADSENYGKTNAKKFQLGIELLADDEDYKKLLNAENMEDYVKISREIVKTLSPLFTENEGTGVDNLFKRADEIIDSGNIPKNDKEWADRLDTSVEMFQALKQRANLYEYNNREYFSSGFTNKLDEYQSLLSNVKTAQDALNECTDTTSNEYMRLSKELDAAKQKYNEFKDGTIGAVEDAYAEYSRFGTKSKESFVYYLEQSMGMEDTDITGVIDVLLDKSKALQENLAKMHPDSAAYELYKKQLDDVNALLSSLDFDIDHIDKTRSLEDKISQYKDLVKEAEGYKKTLETAGEGTDAYKEAAQELERISVLMSDLRDPLTLEISTNISEIDSQISQLDEKLKGLRESLQHASGSNEAYAIHMDIKGAENEKKRLEGEKEELQQTLKIIVDSTEVDEYIPEEKEGSVKYSPDFTDVVNAEVPKLKGEVEYEAKMPSQQPASSAVGSQAKADGTFHAFSQGTGSNVSIPKNEKALVNELGEEGIVRNGKLIPIKGGAQFVSLKRGDIVFNHKQMEQLKKNGYTSSRGKLIGAHAEGTINAYAGTDTYTKYNRGNVLLDWESSPANPKNNTKKDVKDAKEKAEEEKEIFEEVIDWIERRVKNFQRKFDKWVKQAETAITSGFINKYYKKAFKAEKKELNAYGKAYNRYMKEANAVGLDEKYAKKVRNGTIDIEAIRAEGTENDTKKHQELVDKIQKYQEWYIYYAPLSGNRRRDSI